MTKAAAIQSFFSDICTAYPSTAVVDNVPDKYLTYTPVSGMWGDGSISITVNIYCQTSKETTANNLAETLSAKLGRNGNLISCDDGYIWIKRGRPFCQSVLDPTDRNLKRRYINLYAEFLTKK